MRLRECKRDTSTSRFASATFIWVDWPAVHVVPAAICMVADQTPLAQRWNEVPPIQFHWPSGVQAPLRVPLLDEEPEALDELAGLAAGAAGEEEMDAGAGEAREEALDANTPGDPVDWLATDVMVAEVETAGGTAADVEAAGGTAAEVPDGELPVGPSPGPPVQAAWPNGWRLDGVPAYWTESPGSGKRMSTPSVVVQPLILATNRSGKLVRFEREVDRFSSVASRLLDVPPVTVTGAQFMYISRLPIRLNQVQARVY
jgi:hypothetical protein